MISAVLSFALVILVLFVMISLGALPPGLGAIGARLVAVQIGASSGAKSVPKHTVARAARATQHPVAHIEPVPPVPEVKAPPSFIHLSREEFAASDIGHMAKPQADSSDTAQDSAATMGPGEGPGGARLYNADWYREPTHAELSPYLPQGAPPGSWGIIACKTAEHYHVEDCQEIDESPPGSGLATSLRRASWQFLVLPPRIGGRMMVGTWVRIRFEFTRRPEGDHGDPGDEQPR